MLTINLLTDFMMELAQFTSLILFSFSHDHDDDHHHDGEIIKYCQTFYFL